MDDQSKCDLPYGHFGRADYDLTNNEWQFERTLAAARTFTPLEGSANSESPNRRRRIPRPGHAHHDQSAKRHAKQIQSLVRICPDVQAATKLLHPVLKVSEAATSVANKYDPLRGSLLSFAHIWSGTSHRSVPVVAHATGETGCDLRIVRLLSETRGWGHDENSRVEASSISGEEFTLTGRAPIQQVSFGSARIGKSSTVLAVRFHDRVDILQPILAGAISSDNDESPIQLNLLHSLSNERTFGHRCADVAFNPWFPQHIGIVDCDGDWRVFEFASRKLERISRLWSKPADDGVSEASILTDGWGRLAWIGNFETLVVCTRTTLRLYSIAEQHAVLIQSVDIQADSGGDTVWILDFVALPHSDDHFCIVTSQSIVILQVKFHMLSGTSCQTKIRIRHFRNLDDMTLRVCAWSESDIAHLLLYSSANSYTSAYRVIMPSFDRLLAEDPVALHWHDNSGEAGFFRDLHVRPLSKIRKQAPKVFHEAASRILDSFYGATILENDHSITESLWYSRPSNEPDFLARSHGWLSTKESKIINVKVLKEDFVVVDNVDDHENAAAETVSCHSRQFEPIARRARRQTQPQADRDMTVSIEHIANDSTTSADVLHDLGDVLSDAIYAILQPVSTEIPPVRTLTTFVQAEVEVRDTEAVPRMLEDEIERYPDEAEAEPSVGDEEERLYYHLSTISLPHDFSRLSAEIDGSKPSTVYESLVSDWISSLPPHIPGWIRLAKLGVVRRVAAELILASRVIRVRERKEKQAAKDLNAVREPFSHTWELPMRSSGVQSSQTIPSSSQLIEGSPKKTLVLPTPSPTATPSVTTASSYPSTFAAPELLRLSKYTTFERPTPSILPRPLKNVLSHWKQGEDLDEYDWMGMSRHLSRRDEDGDEEEMTEKERKRMQRRAERHIRRQRKEAAASQAQQFASSQAAEVFSASQPAAIKTESQPTGVAASSQSQGPGAFVASQVVPGRFAGRPPPKKKRKQGF